ncbi:L,D-transpeptidase family protein [Aerococcaceae bacterium WGS1372]
MKKTLLIILSTMLVMGIVYFAGVGFYAEKFSANTTFSTVDISNLALVQAEEKIVEDLNDKEFTIKENGEEVAKVTVGELNPEYNIESELKSTYYSQNPSTWVNNLFTDNGYNESLNQQINLNEEKIANVLSEQGLSNDDRETAINAELTYDEENGYSVVEGQSGTKIDLNRLEDALIEGLQTENYVVNLEDIYSQPTITSESEEITTIMEDINRVTDTEITYEIAGETVVIPKKEIENWIAFDANNNMTLAYEPVATYLESLNETYSTFNKSRQFNSTLQGEVTVPAGILGWAIDVEAEYEQLVADVLAGSDIKREPVYYSSGGIAGQADDIGSTYVEIDLSNQYMYLYVDGQIIVETPIVSGKIGAETVPGANAVNEMLTETNLVGYNQFSKQEYSVPVGYWIRFDDKAQGIHDASWQGSFGGNAYQASGSLGCINTPISAVSTIYNNVDYGTPVIVFN